MESKQGDMRKKKRKSKPRFVFESNKHFESNKPNYISRNYTNF